jgi:hypothetical protein
MQYVARVTQFLRPGIHKLGGIRGDSPEVVGDMQLPDRVEFKLDGEPDEPCMIYRYTDSGDFLRRHMASEPRRCICCSRREYGLSAEEFTLVKDDGPIN